MKGGSSGKILKMGYNGIYICICVQSQEYIVELLGDSHGFTLKNRIKLLMSLGISCFVGIFQTIHGDLQWFFGFWPEWDEILMEDHPPR